MTPRFDQVAAGAALLLAAALAPTLLAQGQDHGKAAGSDHSRHAGSARSKKAGSDHSHHGHAGSGSSQPAAPRARALPLPGTRYGHGVTLRETTSLAALLADPDAYDGKRVRVEGKITEVCPMAGCWVNLQVPDSERTVTFKVKDGVIVFPTSDAGKYAVAEGVVSKRELTLEQTRGYLGHLAEETGKPFDPASITRPMTLVRVMGTGAVVRDAPPTRP